MSSEEAPEGSSIHYQEICPKMVNVHKSHHKLKRFVAVMVPAR